MRVEKLTPFPLANRPGLSALAYRAGTHATFLETMLARLSNLPIDVPYHTIIGQNNSGAVETSSDGVVPYTSSHLDGASSEMVIRSGHSVCESPDAQREVIRILRLELNREKRGAEAPSFAENKERRSPVRRPKNDGGLETAAPRS